MKAIDYAKEINWNGTATRMISLDKLPNYKKGQKINAGLHWTDGGEFYIESQKRYDVVFVITESVDGHKVDYDNEQECEDLGCEDCWKEKEVLIDKTFEIVEFREYDEEIGYAEVLLK